MNDNERDKVSRMTKALEECLTVLECKEMFSVMQISGSSAESVGRTEGW